MSKITNFTEAHSMLRRFYGKHATGPYALDRMRDLMAHLGDPQNTLRVIHVAGTSGKTSTAYYVAALLKAVGHTVGLTVSPHVDEANERVQIDLVPLPEAEFCGALGEFIAKVDESGILPSYFELMVAFAFWEFARQKVEYAVVEVGLGGLLDGTNVVERDDKVCVITDIGLDHTEILGDTLRQIAAQKAGIILPNNSVFMYRQDDEVMTVVEHVCAEKCADLHIVPQVSETHDFGLPLFQQRNFHLAEQVVADVLGRSISTTERQQAVQIQVPARMEIIKKDAKTIILDGAHNAQKLQALFESIHATFPGKAVAVLAGFVDGDAFRLERNVDMLTKNASYMILTSFYSEKDYPKRSVDPRLVADTCRDAGYQQVEISERAADALERLLARPEQVLLVAGSFYLLNHTRPLLLEA